MGKIQVLSKNVADMIAAGEVVSRPSSVVKELIENSMDANSKSITVEIKNGGISFIRVQDDGEGILEDDILTAFMTHATSKINKAEDLEAILTYGFRGEALSSIASVSETEMITKTKDSEMGIKVTISGGEVLGSENVGARCGTTMTVKNLFFNTPARFKFLKKDSAEASSVTEVCQKAALSRPDIAFKYINSGKEVFSTMGDNNLLNTIYSIYGKDLSKHMIEVKKDDGEIKVSGFIGTAKVARPNRMMQIFFVNGRSVSSKTMSFALSESFKNELTVGKFPVAFLNVLINPSLVDVNVHPSKTEVKFTDEKKLYDAVYWASKDALYQKPYIPSVEEILNKENINPVVEYNEYKGQTNKEKEAFSENKSDINKRYESLFVDKEKKKVFSSFTPIISKKEENEGKTYLRVSEPKAFYETNKKEDKAFYETNKKEDKKPFREEIPLEEKEQIKLYEINDEIKIVGQVFSTYIIAEKGNEMLLIDQHAAHERLNYEKLMKERSENNVSTQLFLSPEIVSLTPTEMSLWEENKEFLDSIGFETEIIGENDIAVRSAPLGSDGEDVASVIIELLTILSEDRKLKRTYREERAIYSVSCKAAIKANMVLSEMEQKSLVEKVMALSGINTCPHGRPICIKMTKEKIEKEFKRT